MPKAKPASNSIVANFSPDKKKGGSKLKIQGRGTSVLGKPQGDHVTAYGLVQAGFSEIIGSLSKSEVGELFKLEHRNSLRGKRGKLYDFISSIAALDETRAESLFSRVDTILEEYNKKRTRKTLIRAETKRVQGDPLLIGEDLKASLSGIEAQYGLNGKHIHDSLLEMTRLVLTFYNHIPNTAFYQINGFAAEGDEGSIIKVALPKMKKIIAESRDVERDSPALTVKINQELVPTIVSMMHYPEITDKEIGGVNKTAEVILGEHRAYTLANGAKKTSSSRDNDQVKFVNALAKHLHITFAVYPELEEIFDKDMIRKSFVKRMISGQDGNGKMGWSSLNNDAAVEEISTLVGEKMTAIINFAREKHYTEYKEYDELVSSDDEEESTIPRDKPEPKVAVKLEDAQKTPRLSGPERQELEALREFKAMVDAATKKDISLSFKEKLKASCPELYKGKASGIGR